MEERSIYPVILCGGEGTRLWPLSRKAMPKQFARFDGKLSLLQASVQRAEDCGFLPAIMVTNDAYRFSVTEQLEEIAAKPSAILIEPAARNTAPAICAAAQVLLDKDPSALMLVMPSDHLVRDTAAFAKAIAAGAAQAYEGHIVTFGIRSDKPETGYGYIKLDEKNSKDETAYPFIEFVEKPDSQSAIKMLKSGRYLWNAGIFLMSVKTVCDLFDRHQPNILKTVKQAVETIEKDLDFSRLGACYAQAASISLDHAIMEHETGYVVPMSPGWADLGSWRSVWQESEKDADGVAKSENVTAFECENSLLRSESDNIALVGIGLKNITAVATRDAVIISDMDSSQSVSTVVKKLRQDKVKQADEFTRHDRPWGHYETLSLGPRFQVKSIVVKPGGKLSLQSHVHRAEHWVVVEGTATVTIGKERKLVGENQSVYIPLGEIHRLENEGKVPIQLIEVQTGTYLGEDDIVRYEDVYARS